MALPLGLSCKWSVGREGHKAGGEGSISLPQKIGVPTPGSRNDVPLDAREERSRAPGTVSLKAVSGSCPWPNLQLLVVWLCWDTVGIHRSPASKGHSSQDNTHLSYMLAPTKGWFLIQAPNLGCVKGYPCPESGVFRMGSWSTLVPSTAGWIPGMETGRETAAPGDRSRGQTRQYGAKALKELVLTCRNHTVLCGCLAASLPLRST